MTDLNSGIGQVGNAAEGAVGNATETANKAQSAASGAGSAVTGATDKLKSATSQASTTASGNEAGAPSSDAGSGEEESTAKDTSSQDENTSPEDETPVNVDVNVSVLQSSGDPLANLPIQVKTEDGVIHDGFSDADGRLPPLQVTEGARLMFLTKRWDSSIKEIGGITVGSTATSVCLVSPSFLVPVKTEADKGAPGEGEAKIPKYNKQTDDGELKYAEDLKPAASTPSAKPAAAQPASAVHQTTSPASTSGHNGAGAHGATGKADGSHTQPHGPAVVPSASQAAPATSPPAGGKAKTPSKKEYPKSIKPAVPKDTAPASSKPTLGRDKDGKPLAVIEDKHKDEHDAWTWSGFWHFLTGSSKSQPSEQATSGSAGSSSSASSSSLASKAASSSTSSSKVTEASSSASSTATKKSSSASSHQSSSSSKAGMPAAAQKSTSPATNSIQSTPSNNRRTPKPLTAEELKDAIAHEQDVRKQLKDLFDICEEVITYLIPKEETTATLVAAFKGNRFKYKKGIKEAGLFRGFCYKYVKFSLFRAGIFTTDFKNASYGQDKATFAEPDLELQGFFEVTEELIDFRCAAAGDVIVYAWTKNEWNNYKKKNGQNSPNYGHIEIRSYNTYYSDAKSLRKQKIQTQFHDSKEYIEKDPLGNSLNGKVLRLWDKYENIRVYRKIFDIVPTLRINAFLKTISDYECTDIDNQKSEDVGFDLRYRLLHTALPHSDSFDFTDFSLHPWLGKDLSQGIAKKNESKSTAAGAYQCMLVTWISWVLAHDSFDHFKDKFCSAVQDKVAVMILEECCALDKIREGDIAAAFQAKGDYPSARLYLQWTSLPGGNANSKKKNGGLAFFENRWAEHLEKLKNEYRKKYPLAGVLK